MILGDPRRPFLPRKRPTRMITAQDRIDAGWREGPEIGQVLERARVYEGRGVTDTKYLLKLHPVVSQNSDDARGVEAERVARR